MIAVVPSGPTAFGSARSESNRNAVARSPDSAASSNVGFAGVAIETAAIRTAITTAATDQLLIRSAGNPSMLDLRKNSAAVANRFDRDIVAIEYGQEQICKSRVLRIFQMLAALDGSVRMVQQSHRQWIVVVLVAVAHVASVKDRGVIQHRPVTLLC